MVARKPAIKRGLVTSGALRCHVRPSGRLPDRLHEPRLAQDVKLLADRPHLEHLALKDDLRVLLRPCAATEFCCRWCPQGRAQPSPSSEDFGGGV